MCTSHSMWPWVCIEVCFNVQENWSNWYKIIKLLFYWIGPRSRWSACGLRGNNQDRVGNIRVGCRKFQQSSLAQDWGYATDRSAHVQPVSHSGVCPRPTFPALQSLRFAIRKSGEVPPRKGIQEIRSVRFHRPETHGVLLAWPERPEGLGRRLWKSRAAAQVRPEASSGRPAH